MTLLTIEDLLPDRYYRVVCEGRTVREARFEEVRWPLPVWVMTNLSPEFGGEPPRLFHDRDDAVAAARKEIEAYRDCWQVKDQIDEVLAEFNNQADWGGNCGAGDSGALFYVEVLQLSNIE